MRKTALPKNPSCKYHSKGKAVCALSRRMIAAKYAETTYLLQPVTKVEQIEKQGSIKRDSHQKSSYNPFAFVFQQAAKKHEQAKKQLSNGFDVIC